MRSDGLTLPRWMDEELRRLGVIEIRNQEKSENLQEGVPLYLQVEFDERGEPNF